MIKKCVLKWGDNEVEVLEPKGMNPVQIINKNKYLNPLAEWASKEMKEIFTIYPDVIKCEVIQNKAFFTGIIKERKPTNLETFSGMDEGGEMERPEVFLEVCEVEKLKRRGQLPPEMIRECEGNGIKLFIMAWGNELGNASISHRVTELYPELFSVGIVEEHAGECFYCGELSSKEMIMTLRNFGFKFIK